MAPLTPEIIAALLRGENPFVDGTHYSTTNNDYTWSGGDAGGPTGQMTRNFYASKPDKTYDVFDDKGEYLSTETQEGPNAGIMKFLSAAGALYGAGSLINGGMLGFGGGGGAGGAGGLGGMSAEQAAFLEANMGAGAPGSGWGGSLAGGGMGGAGGGIGNLGQLPAVPGAVPDIAATGPLTGGLTPAQIGGIGSGLTIPGNIGGGNLLSGITDALGGAKGVMTAAGLLGGIAGAKGGDDMTSSNKRTLDPRLDSAIFGANGQDGLLSRVLGYANANPTGQNDAMKQASDRQKLLLNDPRVWGGLSNIYGQSQGLLEAPSAGNPFTRPGFNGRNWWGG